VSQLVSNTASQLVTTYKFSNDEVVHYDFFAVDVRGAGLPDEAAFFAEVFFAGVLFIGALVDVALSVVFVVDADAAAD
jgi:hypothetical protein